MIQSLYLKFESSSAYSPFLMILQSRAVSKCLPLLLLKPHIDSRMENQIKHDAKRRNPLIPANATSGTRAL